MILSKCNLAPNALNLVSRGVRHCKMTGTSNPSFCSAELLRRPILRAIGGPNYFLRKSLFFFPPWWSWYVLGPSAMASPAVQCSAIAVRWSRMCSGQCSPTARPKDNQCSMKRVQTRTMTICTEGKINREMARNGLRMHLPRSNNT